MKKSKVNKLFLIAMSFLLLLSGLTFPPMDKVSARAIDNVIKNIEFDRVVDRENPLEFYTTEYLKIDWAFEKQRVNVGDTISFVLPKEMKFTSYSNYHFNITSHYDDRVVVGKAVWSFEGRTATMKFLELDLELTNNVNSKFSGMTYAMVQITEFNKNGYEIITGGDSITIEVPVKGYEDFETIIKTGVNNEECSTSDCTYKLIDWEIILNYKHEYKSGQVHLEDILQENHKLYSDDSWGYGFENVKYYEKTPYDDEWVEREFYSHNVIENSNYGFKINLGNAFNNGKAYKLVFQTEYYLENHTPGFLKSIENTANLTVDGEEYQVVALLEKEVLNISKRDIDTRDYISAQHGYALFNLYKDNNGVKGSLVLSDIRSGEDFYVKEGTYWLEETKPPVGYIGEYLEKLVVTREGSGYGIDVYNKKIYSLSDVKKDVEGHTTSSSKPYEVIAEEPFHFNIKGVFPNDFSHFENYTITDILNTGFTYLDSEVFVDGIKNTDVTIDDYTERGMVIQRIRFEKDDLIGLEGKEFNWKIKAYGKTSSIGKTISNNAVSTVNHGIPNKELYKQSNVVYVKILKPLEQKITINHVDLKTNEVLDTEESFVKVGGSFQANSKPDGTYKDTEGNPYKASPPNQSYDFEVTEDRIITFYYDVESYNLTIKHVDVDTGEILEQVTEKGYPLKQYSFNPKHNYFKNADGEFYVATPVNQKYSGFPTKDMEFVFNYSAIAQVTMTIKHIDIDTNELLDTEEFVVRKGTTYNGRSKDKGFYKDVEGNPYTASPSNQSFSFLMSQDRTETFRYRVVKPDPTEPEVELPATDDGQVVGKTFWELRRPNNDLVGSDVYVNSVYDITGQHYAIRNISHKVKLNSTNKETSGGEIGFSINADNVKGDNINYSFSYEYTNYYNDNYTCVDLVEGNCFQWEFVDRTPDWSKFETFSLSDSLLIDHEKNDTLKADNIESILEKKWNVGKQHSWIYPNRATKSFYEEWSKSVDNDVKSKYVLKTQSTLPVSQGELIYKVELPSNEHLRPSYRPLKRTRSFGNFFPVDVDDSLKTDYKNNTRFTGYDYAFPLQQGVMVDKGDDGTSRSFLMDYTTDMFFVSKHTGLVVGYPYANLTRRTYTNYMPLPSYQELIKSGKFVTSRKYVELTNQPFVDELINIESELEKEKLLRYYLPIDASSILEPNTEYKNHIVLEDMGLNDSVMRFDQTFEFKHYLFGSGEDDAWIIEQVDSRQSMASLDSSFIHKVDIKKNQVPQINGIKKDRTDVRMHGFRFADRDFVDKIKGLIDIDTQ